MPSPPLSSSHPPHSAVGTWQSSRLSPGRNLLEGVEHRHQEEQNDEQQDIGDHVRCAWGRLELRQSANDQGERPPLGRTVERRMAIRRGSKPRRSRGAAVRLDPVVRRYAAILTTKLTKLTKFWYAIHQTRCCLAVSADRWSVASDRRRCRIGPSHRYLSSWASCPRGESIVERCLVTYGSLREGFEARAVRCRPASGRQTRRPVTRRLSREPLQALQVGHALLDARDGVG